MKTVAFYSYKGGTGRTLALANVATFASMAGKQVVVIDMDLEAPGAIYKFLPEPPSDIKKVRGLVGYLLDLVRSGEPPVSLEPYMLRVPVSPSIPLKRQPKPIWLLPAGNVPAPSYFGELKSLQLDERSADGSATQLLKDLLDRIEKELSPDLVLIDARTGITETNSLILAELASDVFAFLLDLPEQRDGVRNVLRSLAPLEREGRPRLNVVLSRVPIEPEHVNAGWYETKSDEGRKAASIRFMREPATPLENTVASPKVLQLHHYDGLISQELLLLSQLGAPGIAEQPLTWDYARLAREVIGDEEAVADVANNLARSSKNVAVAAAAVMSGDPGLRSAASEEKSDVPRRRRDDRLPLSDQLARARAHADRDPASISDLGGILLKVSEAEAALGHEEAAAEAAKEAVSVLRQVATIGISGHVKLARALAAAANRLVELEPDEGLAIAEMAVSEFKASGSQSRTARADLAEVLILLGRLVPDQSVATDYLSEAVQLLIMLSRASNKHEASLASAQIYLSNAYARDGNYDLSLSTALLAVDSARRAFASTSRNVDVLGEALDNAASFCAKANQLDQAEQFLDEGVTRLREHGRSGRDHLVLAKVINNFGSVDRARGNATRALQHFNEEVQILRKLSVGDPVVSTQLMLSLTNFGNELARQGHKLDALTAFDEAIRVGHESEGGNQRQIALASALNEVALLQEASGDIQLARAAVTESLQLLQEIDPRTPQIERHLSVALTCSANLLVAIGDPVSAVSHAQHAVQIEEDLSRVNSESRRSLAAAVEALGLAQLSTGFNDEAGLNSIERAVAYFAELSSSDRALTMSLGNSLNELTGALQARGQMADALNSSSRAVAAFEQAVEVEPSALPGLARALSTFAGILRDQGRLDEARVSLSQAVAVYRDLSNQSSAFTLELNKSSEELEAIERPNEASSQN